MRHSIFLLITILVLASCGGGDKKTDNSVELTKLKQERANLDAKIAKMEAENNKNNPGKATAVTVLTLEPTNFNAYVEVQAAVNGEQNVLASPQAPGIVQNIMVRPGQHVGRGQTLALLDAAAVEQQIKALDATLTLQQSLYERQQKLWSQNIGTEVQLMSAKAAYEAASKQKAALVAQRGMYSIKSPISGTVDAVNIKEGEMASPGVSGIRVVSMDQLKVQATLGENYLGKVQDGNPVNLIFSGSKDTIKSKLSYVSKSVDAVSRAFQVEVRLGSNKNLHPNMSCKMQIANYNSSKALVVPVQVIQKTAEGDMLYIVDGNKAKSVKITTGHNANGMAEVLSGLKAGDKVITEGFADLDNGTLISMQ